MIDLSTAPTSPFEPTPQHARLARLAGAFRGTSSTWLDPQKPAEQTPIEAAIESVLGGRFLRITYTSTVSGKPHAGEMLFAYEKEERRHTMAWIDSFHSGGGILLSVGEASPPEDGPVSVLTHYGPPDQRWGWRTALHLDAERPLLEAFNIPPDGTSHPALRIELARA